MPDKRVFEAWAHRAYGATSLGKGLSLHGAYNAIREYDQTEEGTQIVSYEIRPSIVDY